jgi:hypothetical protein
VVDLVQLRVVWDGAVYGEAGSVEQLERTLEDNLLEALGVKLDPSQPRYHRP